MKKCEWLMLVAIFVIVTLVQGCSSRDSLESRYAESRYAAEAIPVIACLRTKILLYQYDNGILPCIATNEVSNGKNVGKVASPQIETWVFANFESRTDVLTKPSIVSMCYKMASYALPSGDPPLKGGTIFDSAKDSNVGSRHLGVILDIDPLDLTGMYSRPSHYQYLVMCNGTDYAYFIGCFGDGDGLPVGTGYAVCEISMPSIGRRYMGTWRCYMQHSDMQVCFTTSTQEEGVPWRILGCYVPDKASFETMTEENGALEVIGEMKKGGWDFSGCHSL